MTASSRPTRIRWSGCHRDLLLTSWPADLRGRVFVTFVRFGVRRFGGFGVRTGCRGPPNVRSNAAAVFSFMGASGRELLRRGDPMREVILRPQAGDGTDHDDAIAMTPNAAGNTVSVGATGWLPGSGPMMRWPVPGFEHRGLGDGAGTVSDCWWSPGRPGPSSCSARAGSAESFTSVRARVQLLKTWQPRGPPSRPSLPRPVQRECAAITSMHPLGKGVPD